jgi:hypothetical protein
MLKARYLLVLLTCPLILLSAGVAQETKPYSASVTTGRVKGTVTFLFNQYQGHKPDVGAAVVLTPGSLNIPETATVVMIPTLLHVDGKDYQVTAHATVDGSGDYDLPEVPAGKYTLVIRSANTSGGFHAETVATNKKGKPLKKPKTVLVVNQRDIGGKIITLTITVEAGRISDESWDFGETYLPN